MVEAWFTTVFFVHSLTSPLHHFLSPLLFDSWSVWFRQDLDPVIHLNNVFLSGNKQLSRSLFGCFFFARVVLCGIHHSLIVFSGLPVSPLGHRDSTATLHLMVTDPQEKRYDAFLFWTACCMVGTFGFMQTGQHICSVSALLSIWHWGDSNLVLSFSSPIILASGNVVFVSNHRGTCCPSDHQNWIDEAQLLGWCRQHCSKMGLEDSLIQMLGWCRSFACVRYSFVRTGSCFDIWSPVGHTYICTASTKFFCVAVAFLLSQYVLGACKTWNAEYRITKYGIKFNTLFSTHNKSLLETKAYCNSLHPQIEYVAAWPLA